MMHGQKNIKLLKHVKIRRLLQHVSIYKETIIREPFFLSATVFWICYSTFQVRVTKFMVCVSHPFSWHIIL